MKNPLVSIVSLTYNHEKYIRQALESFVMQKTNFEYEIIIHDDASTDNTQQIIREYKKKYPEIIKPILQEENQKSKGSGIVTRIAFGAARGKYIALCEGDDYWTDPYKLQKQVDFLEANPDFSICFHKVKILKRGRIIKDYLTKVPSSITNIYHLTKNGNYIHTCSCVYRNSKMLELPNDISTGDYALYLFITKNGAKIKYFNETMAIYRIHTGGIWSLQDKTEKIKKEILFYLKMYKYFPEDISILLYSKFLLVFTNLYSTLEYEKDREDLFDFVINNTVTVEKEFLAAVVILRNILTSNKYIFHNLKSKFIRTIKRKWKI